MKRTRIRLAASVALATAVTTLGTTGASLAADVNPSDTPFTPTASDLVGVGSDTSQKLTYDVATGVGELPGFNTGKTSGRIATFAADGAPATVVLRQGLSPIARPNGSGAGKGLLYGANENVDVNFARSSSGPSPAEVTASLKHVPFAVDGLALAVRKAGSNAPESITPAQMVSIYKGEITNWSQIGGQPGTIKPLIPQTGSGTRSFFISQLNAANGGATVTLNGVAETQEHSDADLKNDPNAVAPFSTARATTTPTVGLVTGSGSFSAKRALYNVVRGADLTKPAFQEAFGETGFFCSRAAKPLIEATGFEQLASPTKGGVCGVPTESATTEFKVSEDLTQTSLGLAAVGSPNGTLRLTATVQPATAEGTVEFFVNGVAQGDPVEVDSLATARKDVPGLTVGSYEVSAEFTPADPDEFAASSANGVGTIAPKAAGTATVTTQSGTWGVSRTITATLRNGTTNATGQVTLTYGSVTQKANLAQGRATFTVPATTAVGSYTAKVTYPGDDNFAAGTSSKAFSITKASTRTSLSLTKKVKVKKAGKATVKVAVNGSSQKANGRVVLKIGSKTVGTGTVKNGVATVKLAAQKKAGTKKVKATFTPSSKNYGASSSATVAYKVVK